MFALSKFSLLFLVLCANADLEQTLQQPGEPRALRGAAASSEQDSGMDDVAVHLRPTVQDNQDIQQLLIKMSSKVDAMQTDLDQLMNRKPVPPQISWFTWPTTPGDWVNLSIQMGLVLLSTILGLSAWYMHCRLMGSSVLPSDSADTSQWGDNDHSVEMADTPRMRRESAARSSITSTAYYHSFLDTQDEEQLHFNDECVRMHTTDYHNYYCNRNDCAAGSPCGSCRRFMNFKAERAADQGKNDRDAEMNFGVDGQTYYCGREVGQRLLPGTNGVCGPHDGAQCPSCQRYQEKKERNDDGIEVKVGEDQSTHYCNRRLGREHFRDVADGTPHNGVCGPRNGVPCESCKRHQRMVEAQAAPQASAGQPSSVAQPAQPAAVVVARELVLDVGSQSSSSRIRTRGLTETNAFDHSTSPSAAQIATRQARLRRAATADSIFSQGEGLRCCSCCPHHCLFWLWTNASVHTKLLILEVGALLSFGFTILWALQAVQPMLREVSVYVLVAMVPICGFVVLFRQGHHRVREWNKTVQPMVETSHRVIHNVHEKVEAIEKEAMKRLEGLHELSNQAFGKLRAAEEWMVAASEALMHIHLFSIMAHTDEADPNSKQPKMRARRNENVPTKQDVDRVQELLKKMAGATRDENHF